MKKWTYLFVVLALPIMFSVNTFGKERHNRSKKKATSHHVTRSVNKQRTETVTPSNSFNKNFQLEPIQDPFGQKIDELINSWYVKSAFDMDTTRLSKAEIKSLNVPDSVIVRRLQSIPSPVPLSFNPMVKNNIMYYIQRIRWKTEVMLGLSKFYFPIIDEIFDRYELPQELKYLTIIESALNPRAVSPVGACGMWQLMYGTGQQNGLEINSYVDERRDIIKSTEAAAKYLKRLHDIFNDWHLVIAAYNCGPGNVQKAIARNGGNPDYWKIYYSLPQATRDYVPAYIAATYVFHYYKNHQLHPKKPNFPISADTIMIRDYIHLQQVSKVLNIPIEQLREYNPQYRGDVIPALNNKPYALRLPMDKVKYYINNSHQIYAYNREQYFHDNRMKMPQRNNYASFLAEELKGKVKVFYTVKEGDSLNNIAEWFKVRLSDMKNWNQIKKNLVKIGQKVVIYVPESNAEEYNKKAEMHIAAERQKSSMYQSQSQNNDKNKQQYANKEPERKASAYTRPAVKEEKEEIQKEPKKERVSSKKDKNSKKESKRKKSSDDDYTTYTIKKDESLWSVSKKFHGISSKEILKFNGITDPKHLKPGDKIKIPKE